MTIEEFARARLTDERERALALQAGCRWAMIEVEIKQAIVDLHSGAHDCPEADHEITELARLGTGCHTLRLFASLYADHDDYDPAAWTPSQAATITHLHPRR